MAETVVSLALGIIRDLLVEEARFLSGVGNQVREVGDHLQHMQCFLKDMDKRKYEAAAFRNYINKIRDLAFRIEDVVETYAVEVTSRRGRTVRDNLRKIACVLCECTSMHNIGSNVEQIKREITSLDSKVESLNLVRSDNYTDASNQPKKRLRQTYGHEIEEDFVGMEADMNKLIKLIMPKEGDRDHRVISIYGMGGLGKTTLAGKIYNDPVVRGGFQAFAWTCVTQECNSKSVMQDVLKQLVLSTPEEKEMISRMDKRELVLELNNLQKEKKCLVVLDDIWNVADWKDLRPAFASKKANSKVLLTTRKQDVAEVGCPHKLDLLSDEEGWKLLHKKSFSGKDLRGRLPSHSLGLSNNAPSVSFLASFSFPTTMVAPAITFLANFRTQVLVNPWSTATKTFSSLDEKSPGWVTRTFLVATYPDLILHFCVDIKQETT